MTSKQLIIAAGCTSLAALIGAYSFEYIGGFFPCKLCYWQRYPHFFNVLLALFYFLVQVRILIFIGAASMFTSMILAFYHVGVEQKYWLGPNSCTNFSIDGLTTDQLLDQIMSAPIVRCDEIVWEFIGISMAGWNVLISFFLFIIWFLCYTKTSLG